MTLKASTIRIDLPEIPAVVSDSATQRELQLIYNAIHALQLAIDPAISGSAVTVTDSATVNLTLAGQNLQADVNLAAVNYLSSANATDLTDAGDSALHYHLADRIHARNSALHRV